MCNKTDLAIARMPEPTLSNPASSLERKRNSKAAEGNNKAVVVADNSYITSQRPLAVSIESVIENAGLARANAVLSIEKPEGDLDWARQCNGYVCLIMKFLLAPLWCWQSRLLSNNIFYSGIAMGMGWSSLGTHTTDSGTLASILSSRFLQLSSSISTSPTPHAWPTRGFLIHGSACMCRVFIKPRC